MVDEFRQFVEDSFVGTSVAEMMGPKYGRIPEFRGNMLLYARSKIWDICIEDIRILEVT
jgi:hypothetical protein